MGSHRSGARPLGEPQSGRANRVEDWHTVFYTPPVANTPRGIAHAVEARCARLTALGSAAHGSLEATGPDAVAWALVAQTA